MFYKNLLHLFQLEQYRIWRFLKIAYTNPKFRIRGSQRQKIDRTKKTLFLMFFAITFQIADIVGFILYFPDINLIYHLLYGIISFLFIPIYFVVASLCLLPFQKYIERRILNKAKKKLTSMKDLIVIGITGSYGKTSMKMILKSILSSKKVLYTQGNKNTPLGVSDIILKQLTSDVEIFIVEMGAYSPGDIKQLCNLVKPTIGVLTGIGMQHLERFGNIENIIKTKFELVDAIPKDGFSIIDTSSVIVSNEVIQSRNTNQISDISTKYLPNFQGIEFEYKDQKYKTKLLAKHSARAIAMGIEVAKYLGFSDDEISKGVQSIDYTPNRLQLIYNKQKDLYIIDDSYNGNLEGVKSTIDLLRNVPFKGKKIYLTPGLVELGKKSAKVHIKIGKRLCNVVDKVLLINNSATSSIEKGLIKNNFKGEIVKFESTIQAHAQLGKYLEDGAVVVFQNDLTDNYF